MKTTDRFAAHSEMVILYVDDDEDTRAMIGRILAKRYPQARIVFAENGIEGLLKVEEHRPEVIILDLYLPYLDGFSLAEKILSSCKDRHVMVVSGCGDVDVIKRCFSVGVKGFIPKPIDFDRFFQVLDELMLMPTGNQDRELPPSGRDGFINHE